MSELGDRMRNKQLATLRAGVQELADKAERLRGEHLEHGSMSRAGAWQAVHQELTALLDRTDERNNP